MHHWDIALISVVSLMGTAVAYLPHPEQKAFVLMLPVPFTLATLAVGQPVDASNVLSMGVLFAFTIGVWALHVRGRWPILAAIGVCAAGYCAVGAGIRRLCPTGETAFWGAAALLLLVGLALVRGLPYRAEPASRTPLPPWIKLPAIAAVITGLVLLKAHLGGFMTMFPMVGVVAAYEARLSLWTLVRRIPWVILLMLPVMSLIRLTQTSLGLPTALALAWPLYLVLLWALRRQYTGEGDAAGRLSWRSAYHRPANIVRRDNTDWHG
jgi:hypothetical protein